LAKIAQTLNQGFDFTGNELNSPSQFFIGGAANPGAENLQIEIEKIKRKICDTHIKSIK